MHQPQFASVADVQERLGAAGYLTDHAIATTVFLADRLGKPLLIEGPAGVGKTELASRDQSAVHAFYQAVFGWDAEVNPGYTEFQLGSESVAGCLDMPEMVPAQVPSYWMPYFGAQDPAAKAQEAAALGATVLVPFMEMENVAFSVVQDPNGATFGLLHLKEH